MACAGKINCRNLSGGGIGWNCGVGDMKWLVLGRLIVEI